MIDKATSPEKISGDVLFTDQVAVGEPGQHGFPPRSREGAKKTF
jgi:hypothetical protein